MREIKIRDAGEGDIEALANLMTELGYSDLDRGYAPTVRGDLGRPVVRHLDRGYRFHKEL